MSKYVMVPLKPTDEMIQAGAKLLHIMSLPEREAESIYRAMLSALPAQQGQEQPKYVISFMSEGASEERIKTLMAQIGIPNSMSLYQAFKQFQNELEQATFLVPAEAQAEQPQAQAVDSDWRRLALQFDEHRMQAIGHLQAMLRDPQKHALEATKFLAAGPLSGEEVLAQRIAAIAALPAKQLSDSELVSAVHSASGTGRVALTWMNNDGAEVPTDVCKRFARAYERALKGGK
ncbi:MAG TPA: hypothetical protein VJ654_14315 [Noviherbaspirillum sp.]|nr:hypothetical protein [Noviherbaspirillum sp.]